ncbi:hypothetical protein BKA70DRAFT_1092009 [Coprinopsis sp. MPI-PUGE-AT-0042]|nr:hypothetical protein BKA70DRAFT_1092009 [Coprinopsis sp. MPI-PUGE-AT-0042]
MTGTITVPGITGIRRYGSLRVKAAAKLPSTLSPTRKITLPVEIVERTIELYVTGHLQGDAVPFSAIEALSQVSHTIRQTVFRYYFRRVSPNTPRHWAGTFYILARISSESLRKGSLKGFHWVRSLSASAATICHSPERLLLLESLTNLSLDLSHEGITSQAHAMMKRVFGLVNPTTSRMCSSLRSLRLTKVAYIDKRILEMIAHAFPHLQHLYLEATSRLELTCCANCYEDSLTLTQHSPVPRYFPVVQSLADTFGSALKVMKDLQHLHLGIFLSSEHYIENHLHHALDAGAHAMWRWDAICVCETCQDAAESVHRDELLACLRIAQYVPTLKTIGWSTCCGTSIHGELSLDGVDAVPQESMISMALIEPSFSSERESENDNRDASSDSGSGTTTETSDKGDDGVLPCIWMDERHTVVCNIVREAGRVKVKAKN